MTPENFKSTLEFITQIMNDDLLPAVQNLGLSSPSFDISPILASLLSVQNGIDSLSGQMCVLQKKTYQTFTKSSTPDKIPYDNTVPMITEGAEVMAIDFTPFSDTSKLLIECFFSFEGSQASYIIGALFDGSPSCISSSISYYSTTILQRYMRVIVDSSSLAPRRFSLRVGASAGSVNFNYPSTLMGNSTCSNITITEFQP